MKKGMLLVVSALLFGMSASANLIVDGAFDSAVTIATSKLLDADTLEGDDGWAVDDGWITEGSLAAPTWGTSGGVMSRTATTKFSQNGFGQIVSNPLDGNFDNGDTVTYSFDYVNGGGNLGFSYSLYGVNGSGAWAANGGDGINLENDSLSEGSWTGVNYSFVELLQGRDIIGGAGGNVSTDVTLAADFDFFIVSFWADLDSGTGVTVDNVALVPEPATFGLVAFMGGGLLFARRRLSNLT